MQKKKNGFLLFCFSFMPGAGEMYMGFMKMGFSLMGVFMALVALVSIVEVPELAVFPALVYIYSFFHAHNIAGLNDEKFYGLTDDYLFGLDNLSNVSGIVKTKYRKWTAVICIVFGVIMLFRSSVDMLWDYFGRNNKLVIILNSVSDYIPRLLVGALIIGIGCSLIVGKKEEIEEKNTNE